MFNKEWVDEECERIMIENREKSRYRGKIEYLRVLLLIVCVFFCMPIQAHRDVVDHPNFFSYKDGVWFMCSRCRTCQWQDYTQQNWRGEYFCVICGEKYQ